MSKSLGAFAEIGRELKHINENELFLARYPTFMEFVHAELGISWQKAYWFIRVHHRLEQLKAQLPGVEDLPSEEGHMRLLDKVPDELLGAQWERVVRRARERGEGINMRFIKRVVEEENVVREYGEYLEVAPAEPETTGNGETVGTLIHHRDVEESDLAHAWDLIRDTCGEAIVKRLHRRGGVMHGKEVVEWSRCTHDEIRQIANCILNESWTLGRAIMFVEQSIHTNTTIKDLTTWVRTRGKPLRIKSGRKGEYTITVEQK
jgi:hypothetical protein